MDGSTISVFILTNNKSIKNLRTRVPFLITNQTKILSITNEEKTGWVGIIFRKKIHLIILNFYHFCNLHPKIQKL
jgi:hypothetical protein